MKLKTRVRAGRCYAGMKDCEAVCGPGKCAFAAGQWCPGPECSSNEVLWQAAALGVI